MQTQPDNKISKSVDVPPNAFTVNSQHCDVHTHLALPTMTRQQHNAYQHKTPHFL